MNVLVQEVSSTYFHYIRQALMVTHLLSSISLSEQEMEEWSECEEDEGLSECVARCLATMVLKRNQFVLFLEQKGLDKCVAF